MLEDRAWELVRTAATRECHHLNSARCYSPTRWPEDPTKWCIPCAAVVLLAAAVLLADEYRQAEG